MEGPDVDRALPWLIALSSSADATLVVPGTTASARAKFYQDFEERLQPGVILDRTVAREWQRVAPVDSWTSRFCRLQVPDDCLGMLPKWFDRPADWEILWALASIDDFVIEDPLRGMVDQRHYLVHDATRIFLEFRFAVREGTASMKSQEVLYTLVRWMTGTELKKEDIAFLTSIGVNRKPMHINERIDLLIFFLTLADHNALLVSPIFLFDGLEAAVTAKDRTRLRELHAIVQGVSRWGAHMASPVGIMLGFDTRKLGALKRINEPFGKDVERYLAWTR
jgi:hypothetical protein